MIQETNGDYRKLAKEYGRPTMNLMFEKGKLFQRYELTVNPNDAKINVWVEIEGQDNGEVS